MRDATKEEQESVKNYIESISKPTGFNFYDEAQPTNAVGKHILVNAVKECQKFQPCEDCISRQEAIRIAEQGQIQGYKWQFKKLCTLPPVIPQRPRGKWILRNSFLVPYKCSECNYESERYDNYCPNCGAEMWGGGEDDNNINH